MAFIEKLLNQGSAPVLEQMMRFTAERHKLIAQNVVNVSTPNYRQRDLSLTKFQAALGEKLDERKGAPPGTVSFASIERELESPTKFGMLAHDGNNRSMEQLMSDQAKNALMHNLAAELLRKQFAGIEQALKERIA